MYKQAGTAWVVLTPDETNSQLYSPQLIGSKQEKNKYNKYKEKEKKKQIMSKLPHVTHSQHERTVYITVQVI